jgi:hypothetical protein
MLGYNKEQKKARIFAPPCNRWSCPVCSDDLRAQWSWVALYGTKKLQEDGRGLVFVTITSHEKLSVAGAMAVWPSAWKQLHTRIVRAVGPGEYVRVTEQHESGKLHVHMVTTWGFTQTWLKDNARACGLGYIADVRPVLHAPGAALYVSKYLAKQDYAWPKRWRRVSTSRRWPKLDEKPDIEGWQHTIVDKRRTMAEIDAMRHDYESAGYEVRVSKSVEHKIGTY